MSDYLPGDVIEQCQDLLRQGERLEVLAGRLRIDTSALQALLENGRQMRRIPDAAEVDLWASADSVL